MSNARTSKITATEMLGTGANCLVGKLKPGGMPAEIKKVVLRDGIYRLQFRGHSSIFLTAEMVRTLAKAFGDDCENWEGARVSVVSFREKLLVRKEHP